jgi:hypothetical protein
VELDRLNRTARTGMSGKDSMTWLPQNRAAFTVLPARDYYDRTKRIRQPWQDNKERTAREERTARKGHPEKSSWNTTARTRQTEQGKETRKSRKGQTEQD